MLRKLSASHMGAVAYRLSTKGVPFTNLSEFRRRYAQKQTTFSFYGEEFSLHAAVKRPARSFRGSGAPRAALSTLHRGIRVLFGLLMLGRAAEHAESTLHIATLPIHSKAVAFGFD